jgi:uncharacterized membrane protein YdjX (TVP38/TMEM64 family)
MPRTREPRDADRTWRAGVRAFAGAATVLVGVAVALFVVLRGETVALLAWVDGLGWLAAPLFVLLYALEVVVLLPGIVFPLAAGFFFGWAEGAALSVLGKLLGGTCAFLIARRVAARGAFAERAQAALVRSPRLRLLADALPRGGWRLVALVRLVPLIPFKLSNYLFGWSRVTLGSFLLGTLLGTLPYSLANAFLGSTAAGRGLDQLGTARTGTPTTPAQWWISAAVAATASVGAVLVARRALRVLRAHAPGPGGATPDGSEPPEPRPRPSTARAPR